MTQRKPDRTNVRNTKLSNWVRELADPRSGWTATDLDFVFWNFKTKKLMLMEAKTGKGVLSDYWRRFLKDVMNPALEQFCAKNDIDYKGCHLLSLDKKDSDPTTSPGLWHYDCDVHGEPITEREIKEKIVF